MSDKATIDVISLGIASQRAWLADLFDSCARFERSLPEFLNNTNTELVSTIAPDPGDLQELRGQVFAKYNLSLVGMMIERLHAACDIIDAQAEMKKEWTAGDHEDLIKGFLVDTSFANSLYQKIDTAFKLVAQDYLETVGDDDEFDLVSIRKGSVGIYARRIAETGADLNKVDLGENLPLQFLFQRRVDYAFYGAESTKAALDYVEQEMQIVAALINNGENAAQHVGKIAGMREILVKTQNDLDVIEEFLARIDSMCEDPHAGVATQNVPAPLVLDI